MHRDSLSSPIGNSEKCTAGVGYCLLWLQVHVVMLGQLAEQALDDVCRHMSSVSMVVSFAAGRGPAMLVLSPTRELAQQIANVMEDSGSKCGLSTLCVYGGVPKPPQVSLMTLRPDERATIMLPYSGRWRLALMNELQA